MKILKILKHDVGAIRNELAGTAREAMDEGEDKERALEIAEDLLHIRKDLDNLYKSVSERHDKESPGSKSLMSNMTEREERALANIIRYNQLSEEGDIPSHLDPEKEVRKQAFFLTHSVTTNSKGLEVCEDCGEGEAGLYENICTNFLDI